MFLARLLSRYDEEGFSISKFFRKRRLKILLSIIENIYENKGRVRIVDIGDSINYWNIMPEELFTKFNISILIVNIDKKINVKNKKNKINFIAADATENLWELIDQSKFDIMHSNSVIEHVGNSNQMKRFSKNFLKFDGRYFVQTPNFFFPLEPHFMTLFFHWMPSKIQVWLVCNFQLGFMNKAKNKLEADQIIKSCNLLNQKQFSELFTDASIYKEKFLFLTKSLIAIK